MAVEADVEGLAVVDVVALEEAMADRQAEATVVVEAAATASSHSHHAEAGEFT